MLEVGHEFERNGKKYIVLDFVSSKAKKYVLLSYTDPEEKIGYEFYELTEKADGYDFKKVNDDNTISQLFEKVEGEAKHE